MNIVVAIFLMFYTLAHVVMKVGSTAIVIYQVYISKRMTFEQLKETTKLITSPTTLWLTLVEHLVMLFVYIYVIVILL